MSIAGTTKNHGSKDEFCRFYTCEDDAIMSVSSLLQYLTGKCRYPLDEILFIEPSAGDGIFVKALEDAAIDDKNILAYDIAPATSLLCEHSIVKADFLAMDMAALKKQHEDKKYIVFLGNPPFGEYSTLAYKFLNHCFEIADIVSFIMPPSVCKASSAKKFPLATIAYSESLKKSLFRLHGNDDFPVPCRNVLFKRKTQSDLAEEKKERQRERNSIAALPFVFVGLPFTDYNPSTDFTIQRIGGNAGKLKRTSNVSSQSHYACRMKKDSGVTIGKIADILSCTIPNRELTVGPRSISKPELADFINEKLLHSAEEDELPTTTMS